MNGLNAALGELQQLSQLLTSGEAPRCLVAVFPPATLLAAVSAQVATSGILTGGQDCHTAHSGPYTGDVSATMLRDAGAQYVILGHSERRTEHGETSEMVRAKAQAAFGAGLKPIICVGESEAERKAGRALDVVTHQLAASVPDEVAGLEAVIAYEPVWAIGSGATPSSSEIEDMHSAIRTQLVSRFGSHGEKLRILYGGSLKPLNAREILSVANVDGGLVGGASLLANDFYAIISAV